MSPHARPLLAAFCLSLIFVSVGNVGCSHNDSFSHDSTALKSTPHRLELPRVTFGQATSGTFLLRNTTDERLVISRIGPTSCSCNRFELDFPSRKGSAAHRTFDRRGAGLTLAPNEEVQLTIFFDTARFREPISYRVGGIPVVFEDHPAMTLEWACDIYNPYLLEPRSIDLRNIGVRERATGHVGLRNHDDTLFDVILPSEVDGWALRKEAIPNEGGSAWNIYVTAPPELPLGPFQQHFSLLTDLPEAPPIQFEVRGVVVADLSLHPQRVLLRGPHDLAATHLLINKSVHSIATPTIDSSTLPPGLSAVVAVLESGFRWEIRLSYDGDPAPAQSSGEVRISTAHPEHTTMILPWTLLLP